MELIKKDFTKEEKIAIENYLNKLLRLVQKIDYEMARKHYWDARSELDNLYDGIGDLFPFDIEFD